MRTVKFLISLISLVPTLAFAGATQPLHSGGTPWFIWWLVTLGILMLVIAFGVVYHASSKSKNTRVLLRKMKKVDKLKDEFLTNTAHELRTPLNAIIGLTESLIDGVAGDLPATAQQNLSQVVASGLQLNHLINDMMDFTRIKNGQLQLELKAVDLRAMVDVVLALANHMVGDKRLKLVNAVPPGLPTVQADEQRLQQILHNLVGSAVKSTETGHVTVSAVVFGEVMSITVTDSGKGISPQGIERLFDAFQHSGKKEHKTQENRSMGLSLTKQLVMLHGGEIEVKSEVGSGSTYAFTLPVDGQPAQQLEQVPQESVPIEPAVTDVALVGLQEEDSGNSRFRLLLVDDEKVNRQVLCSFLASAHYKLVEATNGQEALDKIKYDGPFDLVLLDIVMTGMSGYEVCQKVRESYAVSELPIVFLTAKNQVLDLVHSFEVGGNDYLPKPVNKFELLARIKTQLTLLETIRSLKVKLTNQTTPLALPDEQKSDDEPLASDEKGTITLIPPDLSYMEILLVDDNVIDSELTMGLLADTGATVTALPDGLAAVNVMADIRFDLVLMDIEMPVMGGIEATRVIRRAFPKTEMPIIALTTHDMAGQLARFKDAGMNDYIAKPLEPQRLYQLLNHYLIENEQDNHVSIDEAKVAIATPSRESFIDKLNAVEGLDTTTALAKMNGKTALYRNLVKAFVRAQHTRGEFLSELFEQQAWGELYRNVHSLKSNAAYIGAYEIAKLSGKVISVSDEVQYDHLLVSPLCEALKILRGQLERIMARFENEQDTIADVSVSDDGVRASVLIIEDSTQMQIFLKSILSDDYTVHCAADGEQGITLAREKMPDIILSDLVMPGKSGYEVCNVLKGDDTTCHIPFVMLTAKTDLESRKQGWREQADEYLTKPCDEDELKLRIVNLLGVRHALKQRFGQVLRHTFEVLPEVSKEYSERDQQFLQRFTTLLDKRCGDSDLKISHVASDLALTVRTLQNKLRSLTDNNFTEYLAQIRIIKAKALLNQGKKVADVAWETGFTEHTYFSKFFKEHEGETPTQFKRRELR